ncbi:hypothetical protein GT370_14865 [Acidocella sp. MX-AZ03]|uniref:ABC transporter permease subunit n=1 Tax=Acidocella sp. MX-AZ03 TaxID=2697363 RepID=UPI0022DD1A4F|nr:hypothetical protein [Acidocella sp. MX-AZ03]WBO58455.1 hypothetical protein GT370_14865 [Acidocella sp. MX-AZ03]
MKHPVLILSAVLVVLGIAAPSLGMPLSKLTEIVIYVLYGLGVNMLVGYTGLVPFGASVFFGCSTYFVAIFMLRTGAMRLWRWVLRCWALCCWRCCWGF